MVRLAAARMLGARELTARMLGARELTARMLAAGNALAADCPSRRSTPGNWLTGCSTPET